MVIELEFDTVADEGRVDECREVEPQHGAERSFETVRTAGPVFHLLADGTLMLASPKRGLVDREFGTNVTVREV